MSLSAMGWLQNSLGLDVTGEWSQIVTINVGGIAYTCLRKTFLKYKDNEIFAMLLSGGGRRSDDGSMVIDRDGTMFRHTLNFLRSGKLLLPDRFDEWELLLEDARFYQVKEMEDAITESFEYQQRLFRKTLPQAVVLTSRGGSSPDKPVLSIVPPLPALASNPAGGGGLLYQGKHVVASLDEAVATILSVYGYTMQHWRTKEGNGDCVFFTLPAAHS